MDEGKAVLLARWNVERTVYSVAISHDNNRVATGIGNYRFHVWDVHTRALVLGPLEGHDRAVQSLAFSTDDTRIVSGSTDCTIRLWDARIGTCIGGPFNGHTDTVNSVAFSHNNTRIVSGSSDHTVRIWDATTGACLFEPLRGHTAFVKSLACSPDFTRIISGSKDGTIRMWDAQTGAPIGGPFMGHSDTVSAMVFSPDSAWIVSGSWDHTIRVWDATTGAPIGKPLVEIAKSLLAVAVSLDGTRIASVSDELTIEMWDSRTGTPVGERLKGHATMVDSVAFSPDRSLIVSGDYGGEIVLWKAPRMAALNSTFSPDDSPSLEMLSRKTSAQDVFNSLVRHGCTDLSSSMDPTRQSSSAIASGGFGDVWQAWLRGGTMVAVKCLRLHIILDGGEKGMKRMARELYHWSKARHENIQELLGIVTFKDQLGMVSLWMENGNLQQYLEGNPHVIRYPLCVQLATGVAYLHGIGMVHGDLKALNVLVSADGTLKISDFDYSILPESTLRFSQTTKVGGGTVRWMAPELLLHQENEDSPPAHRDMRTDVYALGMTMLETISGKVPYHQFQYDVAIIRALDRKQPPRRPEQLTGPDERLTRTWGLLLACWDHDPSARPAASAVLETLRSFAP